MTATTATAPSAAIIEAIKQKAKRLSILSMMSTTALVPDIRHPACRRQSWWPEHFSTR
jgi:hypothetical protein